MPGFQNPDGSQFNEQDVPVRVVAPATGATVTMKNTDTDLCINPAGTIATLTVKLPTKPEPGRKVDVFSTQTVTALTLQDGFAGAISGSPTTIAAGGAFQMRYVSKALGWKKWR